MPSFLEIFIVLGIAIAAFVIVQRRGGKVGRSIVLIVLVLAAVAWIVPVRQQHREHQRRDEMRQRLHQRAADFYSRHERRGQGDEGRHEFGGPDEHASEFHRGAMGEEAAPPPREPGRPPRRPQESTPEEEVDPAALARLVSTDPRPDWADEKPTESTRVVTVGPYASHAELRQQRGEVLLAAVRDHVDEFLWDGPTPPLPVPYERTDAFYDFARQIHRTDSRATGDLFVEEREHSFGKMYTLYQRLHFNDRMQDELLDVTKDAIVIGRLRYLGAGIGLVLAWLGLMYAGLRFDTATRGAYSGRLQAAAALVTLVVLAGGVFVGRHAWLAWV